MLLSESCYYGFPLEDVDTMLREEVKHPNFSSEQLFMSDWLAKIVDCRD